MQTQTHTHTHTHIHTHTHNARPTGTSTWLSGTPPLINVFSSSRFRHEGSVLIVQAPTLLLLLVWRRVLLVMLRVLLPVSALLIPTLLLPVVLWRRLTVWIIPRGPLCVCVL